jgi:hypothetical protein
VLVVLHPDGYVEVFGSEAVRPVVVNRLDSTADPNLVDRYVEAQIPRSHKGLFFPGNVRATGFLERRTAEAEFRRLAMMETVRRIQETR